MSKNVKVFQKSIQKFGEVKCHVISWPKKKILKVAPVSPVSSSACQAPPEQVRGLTGNPIGWNIHILLINNDKYVYR